MALLLDAGAFVAFERGDSRVRARLGVAQERRIPVRTGAPVIAQVWRDGRRQANLARVLAGVDVRPFERREAQRAGELLAATRTTDVVDAHLALLAEPGDRILTSDPEDLGRLLATRGVDAAVTRV